MTNRMTTTDADINNDSPRIAQISTWALIARGVLLIIFSYVGYIWLSSLLFTPIGMKVLTTLRLDSSFFNIILPCLFHFLIGVFAGYLFWPRGYWAIAIWLVCYYPVRSGFLPIWKWAYLLIVVTTMAGYTLQRILYQKSGDRRNLRVAVVGFVIVAGVVFAVERIVANVRFHTSEPYAKATTIDLPFYENASDIHLKRSKYRGYSRLTFTSKADETRELFYFYDRVFTESGYTRRREPTFDDSDYMNIRTIGGKRKPFKTRLMAEWTDQANGVLIIASEKSDPGGSEEHENVLETTVYAYCSYDKLYPLWGGAL